MARRDALNRMIKRKSQLNRDSNVTHIIEDIHTLENWIATTITTFMNIPFDPEDADTFILGHFVQITEIIMMYDYLSIYIGKLTSKDLSDPTSPYYWKVYQCNILDKCQKY